MVLNYSQRVLKYRKIHLYQVLFGNIIRFKKIQEKFSKVMPITINILSSIVNLVLLINYKFIGTHGT